MFERQDRKNFDTRNPPNRRPGRDFGFADDSAAADDRIYRGYRDDRDYGRDMGREMGRDEDRESEYGYGRSSRDRYGNPFGGTYGDGFRGTRARYGNQPMSENDYVRTGAPSPYAAQQAVMPERGGNIYEGMEYSPRAWRDFENGSRNGGGYAGTGRSGASSHPGFRGQDREGPHLGKGPKGYRRSDQRIEEEVCDALTNDPDLDASEIEVGVSSGVVTLQGTVDDRRAKRMAEDCLEHLSGVVDVRNELRVRSASSAGYATGSAGSSGAPSKTPKSSTIDKGKLS